MISPLPSNTAIMKPASTDPRAQSSHQEAGSYAGLDAVRQRDLYEDVDHQGRRMRRAVTSDGGGGYRGYLDALQIHGIHHGALKKLHGRVMPFEETLQFEIGLLPANTGQPSFNGDCLLHFFFLNFIVDCSFRRALFEMRL